MRGGNDTAIYHLSVKIVGRSTGRSAIAAAAYRSGENITNEWDGVTHDFTKKSWVEFKEILLPENAPSSFKDRKILWNAVEEAEKSKTAQLAREFEIALPRELSRAQQIKLIETFAGQLVNQGMCVDIALHDPPKTNDRHQPIDTNGNVTRDITKMQFLNPHAHLLCTMRPIGANGNWEAKSQAEYVCCRENEEKSMTAYEYASAKAFGWKKLYQYQTENKKKAWLTADEGAARGLKRLSKQPKTTPYGRKNPTVEFWNSEERIPEWRKAWEVIVNDALQKNGFEERIDSRSYEERKIDRLPTIHMGTAAINMEKRAERELKEDIPAHLIRRSDIGGINREIRGYNSLMEHVEHEVYMLINLADNIKNKIRNAFQVLKIHIKANENIEKELKYQKNEAEQEVAGLTGRIKYYEKESDCIHNRIDEISDRKEQLIVQLCGFNHILHPKRTAMLKQEVASAEQELADLKAYLSRVKKDTGFETEDELENAKNRAVEINSVAETVSDKLMSLAAEQKNMVAEYMDSYNSLPDDLKSEVEGLEKASLRKNVLADEKQKQHRM